MESEKEHEYFILETVEVALIGLFSLVRSNIALMRNQQITVSCLRPRCAFTRSSSGAQ